MESLCEKSQLSRAEFLACGPWIVCSITFPMHCAERHITLSGSSWIIEDWSSTPTYAWGTTGLEEKKKFGIRADLQLRTTPGHLRMFFKKTEKEDESACQMMEFEHGLGRLLMKENLIVLIEIPLERVGAHDPDVGDDGTGLPPLQLYHRYDCMGDRLVISLVGSDTSIEDWTSSLQPLPDTLGYDLLFGFDSSNKVIGLSIMFASEHLPNLVSSSS